MCSEISRYNGSNQRTRAFLGRASQNLLSNLASKRWVSAQFGVAKTGVEPVEGYGWLLAFIECLDKLLTVEDFE